MSRPFALRPSCPSAPHLAAAAALVVAVALPLPAGAAGAPPPFEDVTAASGLDFVHFSGATGDYQFPEISGAGGALLDYDGDGDLDLFLVQGSVLTRGKTVADVLDPPPAGVPLSDRLFRNDPRDGVPRFTDVTAEAGFAGEGDHGQGVAAGDYDGDGHVDLYVTNAGPNRLWRNRGDGTFEDVTAAAGAGDHRWSVPAAFFDADGDGDLDLFVANYLDYEPARNVTCLDNSGSRDYCGPNSYEPVPDRLLLNRGDGTFQDVTGPAGLDRAFGSALGAVTLDADGDGDLDLYVANDGEANQLWIRQADGTYRDESLLRGAALNADGRAEAGMGTDAADFDGDGDEDLFVTHLDRETNTLYVNDGDGFFTDRSIASGLGTPSWPYTGFGTGWIDWDHDGWLDLLITNGAVRALEAQRREGDPLPFRQGDLLFRNLGPDGAGQVRFAEVTDRAGPAFAGEGVGRGALFGDLDGDGDLDVVLTRHAGPARVLLNRAADGRSWIGVRAVLPAGPEGAGRRDALGARVEVRRAAGPPLVRRARTDGSYASARDPRVLVGLGDHREPVEVRVTWPGGGEEVFADLEPGRYHTLLQGTGKAAGAAMDGDGGRDRSAAEPEERPAPAPDAPPDAAPDAPPDSETDSSGAGAAPPAGGGGP